MASNLSAADERKLVGVNARLATLVRLVSSRHGVPVMVVEGVRTRKRQQQLFKEKKTKTLNSKHIIGRAVDIAPLVDGKPSWDWQHYKPLVECAKRVAAEMDLPMAFGYDWGWDAPHWEMK